MENKKALSFTFTIVAIILGVTLFKQFDFENLRFKKTGIAIVYIIGFAISIYFLTKNYKNQPKK
jgi:predicted ferric reductase